MAEVRVKIKAVGVREFENELKNLAQNASSQFRQISKQNRSLWKEDERFASKIELEKTRFALREIAKRKREEEKAVRDTQRAVLQAAKIREKALSKQSSDEQKLSSQREREAQQEIARATRVANALIRERTRAETRSTAETERESKRRAGIAAREEAQSVRESRSARRESVARFASGMRTAYQGARQVFGDIQEARGRRAVSERDLGIAIRQVGGNRADVTSAISRITGFAASRESLGMTTEQISSAIMAAQGETSFLESKKPGETVGSRIESALRTMREGVAVGVDPGEMLRLQGALRNTGMDEKTQRQMLLYTAGASARGAVEAGTLSRNALSSIQMRMTGAVNDLGAMPGLSASEQTRRRMDAQKNAFVEQVAELQVARSMGATPRQAGNAMANVATALRGTETAEKMFWNVKESQDLDKSTRDRLISDLFITKGDRHLLRKEMQNPLALAQKFGEISGGNATMFQNVFGGFGRGLQANWRRLLGSMVGQDAEGVAGWQRVKNLMQPNVAMTERDITAGREMFENDELSQLNRNMESRDNALLDNTSTMKVLSDRFAEYAARNPVMSTMLPAVLPAVTGGIAGALPAAIPQIAAKIVPKASGAAGAVAGRGGGLLSTLGKGAGAIGSRLSGAAGFLASILQPSNQSLSGATTYTDEAAQLRAYRKAGGGEAGLAAARGAGEHTGSLAAFRKAVAEGIKEGMREATVNISPHAATHAATQAVTARNQRPTR